MNASDRYRSSKGAEGSSYDISATGWNSPANHHYKPLGELANVYRGCKIVKERLTRFNIDLELPEKQKHCRFLKGEDRLLSFVARHREEARMKERNGHEERRKKGRVGVNRKETLVKKWAKRHPSCDDGMQILKEQLIDSFARLSSARAGSCVKEIFRAHGPSYYSPQKPECGSLSKPCIANAGNARLSSVTCNSPFFASHSKRLSAKDFDALSVSLSYRRKKSLEDQRMNNSCDISIQTSKPTKPYIKLVSLHDLTKNSDTNRSVPFIPGMSRKFDPTKLVELVDAALDKLYQSAVKARAPPLRRVGCAPSRRRFTHNLGGMKNLLDGRSMLRRQISSIPKGALQSNGRLSPIKKPEARKESAPVNLGKIETNIASDLMDSLAVYNSKKEDLKNALANSLDAQANNRHDVIEYKRHNFNLELSNKPFQYTLSRMLLASEKEKIERQIHNLRTCATSYYRLAFELLKRGNEFPQEIHYIMDYYKSLIESGSTLKPQHVLYLMENVYPSDSPQLVTE